MAMHLCDDPSTTLIDDLGAEGILDALDKVEELIESEDAFQRLVRKNASTYGTAPTFKFYRESREREEKLINLKMMLRSQAIKRGVDLGSKPRDASEGDWSDFD